MLDKKSHYLQVALNGSLEDAKNIVFDLPQDKRIILEAGTPLIKNYGAAAIRVINEWWASRFFVPAYVVADMKCQDRGLTEVNIAQAAGASAITVNGQAPLETIDSLILECQRAGLDSMVDMMNVDQPIKTLRKLKKLPTVVILHRGVDEEAFSKNKPVPFDFILPSFVPILCRI